MNIIKRLANHIIVTLLRALGREKKQYPPKLYHKTRADFIESIKKHNDK